MANLSSISHFGSIKLCIKLNRILILHAREVPLQIIRGVRINMFLSSRILNAAEKLSSSGAASSTFYCFAVVLNSSDPILFDVSTILSFVGVLMNMKTRVANCERTAIIQ